LLIETVQESAARTDRALHLFNQDAQTRCKDLHQQSQQSQQELHK
jgi:hypothetical protein